MRANVVLSVVELPRTLSRIAQLLAHRFGAVEQLQVQRVGPAHGTVTVVLDGAEARIGFLVLHFERLVGVTAVRVHACE